MARASGCDRANHSRPLKAVSTGPRKYSSCGGGGSPPGVSKRTRRATLPSSTSDAMLPMLICPDRPVRALVLSPGMPHSGAMRGNSTNSSAIRGAPSSIMCAAVRMAWVNGGRPTGMWALTSAVSRPSNATSMAAATGRACEKKKLASSVKKPRKNTTMASRRARSSSVLSASSITISVTPASRPTMVPCDSSVSSTTSANSTAVSQRPGSGRLPLASQARQTSSVAVMALAQAGRCAASGAMQQAMTASRNSVSRASRGRRDSGARRAARFMVGTCGCCAGSWCYLNSS